jgi:hypothetical protein
MATVEGDLLLLEERARRAAGVPVRRSEGSVELVPGSLREVARARAVLESLGEPPERLRISLENFERIEPPEPACGTIAAGARARLSEVEAVLEGWGLTLGHLSPGALSLSVGEWVEGRYAGLRVGSCNRLESAVDTIGVALRGGGVYSGPVSARLGCGPVLESLFFGAGGQAGALVETTLQARPRPEVEETFHSVIERPEEVVALLREAGEHEVPIVEAQTRRKARGIAVSMTLATQAFRARRDRSLIEEMIKRRGELRAAGHAAAAEAPFEGEIGWDRLAWAIGYGGPLSIYRLARESVVVAALSPVKGAQALDAAPEPLPAALLAVLEPDKEQP